MSFAPKNVKKNKNNDDEDKINLFVQGTKKLKTTLGVTCDCWYVMCGCKRVFLGKIKS